MPRRRRRREPPEPPPRRRTPLAPSPAAKPRTRRSPAPEPARRGTAAARFRRCRFSVKKTLCFKKKPRSFFFWFYYFTSVYRTVRFNERVRRFFSVNERPLFNRSSVFFFVGFFSLFSQIRFLIESSFLFNFSLVYRNQVIQAPRVSSRNSLSV